MTTKSNPSNTILSSDWLGLNELLIARFYPVNNKGLRDGQEQIEVHAPLIDANVESTFNWQSPFEQSSPDTKAPALMAMLQSGAISGVANDLRAWASGTEKKAYSLADLSTIERSIKEFEGRTGITKLNSTQIFTGMPPIKITVTLLFRAYMNPLLEVERPLQKLWSWALPKKLSSDSVVSRVAGNKGGAADYIKALLPSEAPQMIGFHYKRQVYAPMVIESMGEPLNSPVDKNGSYTEIAIPLTLATLTALDKDDMIKIRTSGAAASRGY